MCHWLETDSSVPMNWRAMKNRFPPFSLVNCCEIGFSLSLPNPNVRRQGKWNSWSQGLNYPSNFHRCQIIKRLASLLSLPFFQSIWMSFRFYEKKRKKIIKSTWGEWETKKERKCLIVKKCCRSLQPENDSIKMRATSIYGWRLSTRA